MKSGAGCTLWLDDVCHLLQGPAICRGGVRRECSHHVCCVVIQYVFEPTCISPICCMVVYRRKYLITVSFTHFIYQKLHFKKLVKLVIFSRSEIYEGIRCIHFLFFQ